MKRLEQTGGQNLFATKGYDPLKKVKIHSHSSSLQKVMTGLSSTNFFSCSGCFLDPKLAQESELSIKRVHTRRQKKLWQFYGFFHFFLDSTTHSGQVAAQESTLECFFRIRCSKWSLEKNPRIKIFSQKKVILISKEWKNQPLGPNQKKPPLLISAIRKKSIFFISWSEKRAGTLYKT